MKLFTIEEALKVRNHYKDILIGMPITPNSVYKICGVFVCHEGNVHKALDILMANNFDEKYPIIGVRNDEQRFQVFVYMYDGANIAYDELDANLTEKGIAKIYEA